MIIGGTPDALEEERRVNEMSGSGLVITNVRLPHKDHNEAARLWQVTCQDGLVSAVSALEGDENPAMAPKSIDANGSLMLPSSVHDSSILNILIVSNSLCHSHIHLDKCFILDECGDLLNGQVVPSYAPSSGI